MKTNFTLVTLEIDPALFRQHRQWLIEQPVLPYESSFTDQAHCEGLIKLLDAIADQSSGGGEND